MSKMMGESHARGVSRPGGCALAQSAFEHPRMRTPTGRDRLLLPELRNAHQSCAQPFHLTGQLGVEFLDDYAKTHRVASRSAVVQRAVRLLRPSELTDSYAAAFTEWSDDPSNAAWGSAARSTGPQTPQVPALGRVSTLLPRRGRKPRVAPDPAAAVAHTRVAFTNELGATDRC